MARFIYWLASDFASKNYTMTNVECPKEAQMLTCGSDVLGSIGCQPVRLGNLPGRGSTIS